MTRFERELSGALGAYWKTSAEKELEKIRAELEQGLITIDENGVARNRIGRVLMSDMLEKLTYITDEVDAEATAAARDWIRSGANCAITFFSASPKSPTSEQQMQP